MPHSQEAMNDVEAILLRCATNVNIMDALAGKDLNVLFEETSVRPSTLPNSCELWPLRSSLSGEGSVVACHSSKRICVPVTRVFRVVRPLPGVNHSIKEESRPEVRYSEDESTHDVAAASQSKRRRHLKRQREPPFDVHIAVEGNDDIDCDVRHRKPQISKKVRIKGMARDV